MSKHCITRGCKKPVCDKALVVCFEHVTKNALLMLIDELRKGNSQACAPELSEMLPVSWAEGGIRGEPQ